MKRATVAYAMRTTVAALSILVCTGGICSVANAQAWLPDRQYTEGPGIRVGNLELHPGLAVRGGWDSNVFRTKGDAAYPRLSSGLISITPHLHLSTLGTQRATTGEDAAGGQVRPKIAFDSGVAATYFQYTKSEAQPSGANVGVDTESRLQILPARTVGADVTFGYQRSVQPFTQQPFQGNYARDVFAPGLRLRVGSASQVLTSYVGYAPTITYFEKKAQDFDYLNAANHVVQAGAAWKFLPHTALLFDGEVGLQRYFDPTANPDNAVLLSDSTRVQTRLGLNGAFTKRLSLRLFAGYAAMMFSNELLSEYENAVGEAILGYRFGQSNQFDVGYTGTVTPSSIGGWMRTDRGFARVRTLIAGVFSLGAEAGAGYATYGRALRPGPTEDTARPLGADGETERHDVRIDGAVRAEYRLTNWLALMADFLTIANLTDFEYDRNNGDDPIGEQTVPPLPAQFLTFQAYGGIRAHY
jgi:hypothetical protein